MCTGSCLDYLDLFKLDWLRPLFESAWLVGDPESQGLAGCFPRCCHLPHTQQVLWNIAHSVKSAAERCMFWKDIGFVVE
jgi:hypothetical protein